MEAVDFMDGDDSEAVIDMQLYYEPGEWEIPSVYLPDLNIIARRIKGHLEDSIEIASYTDAIGDESSNLDLSQIRADAIVSYLI